MQPLKQERFQNSKLLIEIAEEMNHFEQMGEQPQEIEGSHSNTGSPKKEAKDTIHKK